jgi:hypothetical protein
MYAKSRSVSWLLVVVALATGFGMFQLARNSAKPAAVAGGEDAIAERLRRLEAEVPALKRSMSTTGARLATAALAASPATATTEATAPLNAPERSTRELRHYDHLDELARAGGGAVVAAQIRKNVAHPDSLSGVPGPPLDITRLDCSNTICRVEVRPKGAARVSYAEIAYVLTNGMGTLTMRPYTPGQSAVYYVSAPDQPLPALHL